MPRIIIKASSGIYLISGEFLFSSEAAGLKFVIHINPAFRSFPVKITSRHDESCSFLKRIRLYVRISGWSNNPACFRLLIYLAVRRDSNFPSISILRAAVFPLK